MAFRDTTEHDILLARRTCMVVLVIQAVLGAFMLMNTMRPAFHLLMAALLVAMYLLVRRGWHRRGCRVVTRVITALPFLLCALFAVDLVLGWGDSVALTGLLSTLCMLTGVTLAYFTVGAAYAALKGGLYDRIVACFCATLSTILTTVCAFYRPVQYMLLWSWDNDVVRYIWLGMVAAAALLVWLCAFLQLPEEKAAASAKKHSKQPDAVTE